MDNTFQLISAVCGGMHALISSELEQEGLHGLVPSHGTILMTLFGGKKLSMQELSTRIGKAPQTVTTLVRKLVQHGYVVMEKSSEDKRVTVVSLTAEGEALRPLLLKAKKKLYEAQYEGFTESEILTLRRLLQKMADHFSS